MEAVHTISIVDRVFFISGNRTKPDDRILSRTFVLEERQVLSWNEAKLQKAKRKRFQTFVFDKRRPDLLCANSAVVSTCDFAVGLFLRSAPIRSCALKQRLRQDARELFDSVSHISPCIAIDATRLIECIDKIVDR